MGTRFFKDQGGGVAILFALAIVPFLGVMFLAIEFGRTVNTKTSLQAASDAAALAAAAESTATPKERRTIAQRVFSSNFPTQKSQTSLNIKDSTLKFSAKTQMSNVTGSLFGSAKREIEVASHVKLPTSSGAEIALVLDYSGSMNSVPLGGGPQKFATMRDAVKDLIATLSDNGKNARVAFSLVPFASGVYAHLQRTHLTDRRQRKLRGSSRVWSCIGTRKSDNNTDSEPADGQTFRWQQSELWYDYDPSSRWWLARVDCNKNLRTQTLTSNIASLHAHLNRWKPNGGTFISAGFAMGWHAISPNSVFQGGSTYSAINHQDSSQRTIKAIVLLTDGAQSGAAYRARSSRGIGRTVGRDRKWPLSPENGELNLQDQCMNARAKGITVVTVGFDLDDADPRDRATLARLKKCASPVDPRQPSGATYFYDADSSAELVSAFGQIGTALSNQIALSK